MAHSVKSMELVINTFNTKEGETLTLGITTGKHRGSDSEIRIKVIGSHSKIYHARRIAAGSGEDVSQ